MADEDADPLWYETHTHTPLCLHAIGEPQEYAETARRRGLRGMVVTCHNPMPAPYSATVRMRPDQLPLYVELVARTREQLAGSVDVRLGLECDYFPGYEAWLERQLATAEFQYVLGSVHPQVAEFRERFWRGNVLQYQRDYFALLAEAAETGLFDCLSHPDLIKNELPSEWEPSLLMDDIRRTLDRIAITGVAMELNTSGLLKIIPEMNPFPEMLREMCCRGIPVVVGSDAHEPERVGDRFPEALDLLQASGYQHVSIFLQRKRHDISISDARRTFVPPPAAARSRPLIHRSQKTATL